MRVPAKANAELFRAALEAAENKDPGLMKLASASAFKKLVAAATCVAKSLAADEQAVSSGLVNTTNARLEKFGGLVADLQRDPVEVEAIKTALKACSSCHSELSECMMRLPSSDDSAHRPLRDKAASIAWLFALKVQARRCVSFEFVRCEVKIMVNDADQAFIEGLAIYAKHCADELGAMKDDGISDVSGAETETDELKSDMLAKATQQCAFLAELDKNIGNTFPRHGIATQAGHHLKVLYAYIASIQLAVPDAQFFSRPVFTAADLAAEPLSIWRLKALSTKLPSQTETCAQTETRRMSSSARLQSSRRARGSLR